MTQTKTPRRSAERLIKQAQALQLRAHGHSIRGIAKALGCAVSNAHALVNDAFAAEREGISQAKADLVEIELLRCETYLQAIAKKVQGGDIRAIDTALRVAERRAKLLGLDAAVRSQLSGPDDGPIQLDQRTVIEFVKP